MNEMAKLDLAKYVGSKIKQYRVKKGMTQRELGERFGKSHNTISNYETGTISPEQDALFSIAKALDIKVDDLFPPMEVVDKNNNFEKALKLTEKLNVHDMDILLRLIEKTLSVEGEEREKLLESMLFTIEYHERMNKN